MIVSWGGFKFPIGQAAVFHTRRSETSDAQQQLAIINSYTISGMLLSNSPQQLLQIIANFERAFAVEGQDLRMTLPTGELATVLVSSQCIGGTRVTQPPSYPEGRNTEWVNLRSFTVTVEGKIATPGARGFLVSFAETLSFVGNGGPLTAFIEPANGFPIEQRTKERSVCRATQSGKAVGYLDYPPIPLPMWPTASKNDRWANTYDPPRPNGNDTNRTFTHFPVSWNYQFESAFPFSGRPHTWLR